MTRPAAKGAGAAVDLAKPNSSFPWPIAVCLLIGLGVLGLAFAEEARAAVEVWNASTAYSHCFLVLPMTLYLLWDRRSSFQHLSPEPESVWAVAAIPVAIAWLAAERLGIMEGRQLAAIAGVEVLMLTLLGRKLFTAASGPLLFLFFLVPFGAFLTPVLQNFTAAFSIAGLDLLGIPNYSDKFTIETPAGVFFVAEACAGLRFLIAAVAFGVFYSLLTYRSYTRRALFILASIIVPIVANGFRALGIVVLGQILGSADAAAADHIVYGWLFFSVVMLLLIAAGQMFREDSLPYAVKRERVLCDSHRSPAWAAFAVVLPLSAGPILAAVMDRSASVPIVSVRDLLSTPDGCSMIPVDATVSQGEQRGAILCGGTRFDVSIILFGPRATSTSMMSARRRITRELGAEDVSVASVDLREGVGAWTIVQTTDPNRVTAYASWVSGQPSDTGIRGRFAQARNSILGSNYATALIAITTGEPAKSPPEQRKAVISKITSILNSQTGLNHRMADVTRI